MHGQIHDCLKLMMIDLFGKEKFEELLKVSGCDGEKHFMKFTHYDEEMTVDLLVKTAEILDLPLNTVLEEYGIYWVKYVLDIGYAPLMHALGCNIRGFVENVDTIHTLLSECYDGIVPPMYRCEPLDDGNLLFHYLSYRPQGLYRIATGVILGAARYLYDNCEVTVDIDDITQFKVREGEVLFHVICRITLPPDQRTVFTMQRKLHGLRHSVIGQKQETGNPAVVDANGKQVMSVNMFRLIYPYHVIMDTKMIIKQVGTTLQEFCPSLKPGSKMTDTFEIVYPRIPFTLLAFLNYVNTNFNMRVKEIEGSIPLLLKGQMIPMDDNHVIFVCSPKMRNLDELIEKKLFLNDIPIFDTTRQFVMLNQVRNAEINISAKLEETTMALDAAAQSLEVEQEKIDMLLHELLPRKVADQLKKGEKVEAEKFEHITILFSDIVGFTVIARNTQPMDIVKMLTELYAYFDKLSTDCQVYKVETIGDAYMVVGGLPEPVPDHAERVAEFSIGMVASAAKVMSPVDGTPLKIRVGLHSGPVVAGVVGERMPRYCLFGDTVNTAAKMESGGVPEKIHVSPWTYKHLKNTDYIMEERGITEIKGKGEITTYFLTGKK